MGSNWNQSGKLESRAASRTVMTLGNSGWIGLAAVCPPRSLAVPASGGDKRPRRLPV